MADYKSWWPRPGMASPNNANYFYATVEKNIDDTISLRLGNQVATWDSDSVSPFPVRSSIEMKHNASIYVGSSFDVLAGDGSGPEKVRYQLTNMAQWDPEIFLPLDPKDNKGVYQVVSSLDMQMRVFGLGLFKSRKTPEGNDRMPSRVRQHSHNRKQCFCEGRTSAVSRPMSTFPSVTLPSSIYVSAVVTQKYGKPTPLENPSVLWASYGKFATATAIRSEDVPAIYPSAEMESKIPYVHFLGKGELCDRLTVISIYPFRYSCDQGTDPYTYVYLSRIRATENAVQGGEVEYFQGTNEAGYSVWERYDATDAQKDGYRHAAPLYDLNRFPSVPMSVTRYPKTGELWLLTDEAKAGGLLYSSIDGIHWKFRAKESLFDTGLTGADNKAYYENQTLDYAQVYGHTWVPASGVELAGSEYLYYTFSNWLSFTGFRHLADASSRFRDYNVKMVRFKVPDPIPYLITHDGYIAPMMFSRSFEPMSLHFTSAAVALPFKGYFGDKSRPSYVKQNVVMNWCKCLSGENEESCKKVSCKPWDQSWFNPPSTGPGWHLGTYENFNITPMANKVGGSKDPYFTPASGQILQNISFSTDENGEGRASVPIWYWAGDTQTPQDASANVILRFSYYDTAKLSGSTSDLQNGVLAQLKQNYAKAYTPSDSDSNDWYTTQLLTLAHKSTTTKYSFSRAKYIWEREFLLESVENATRKLIRAKYDTFTRDIIELGTFSFTSDTPAELQVLPENYSVAGIRNSDGSAKAYLYGTNKTATNLPIIYESVTATTTGAMQWRPHTVHSADNGGVITHVVSLPSPVPRQNSNGRDFGLNQRRRRLASAHRQLELAGKWGCLAANGRVHAKSLLSLGLRTYHEHHAKEHGLQSQPCCPTKTYTASRHS